MHSIVRVACIALLLVGSPARAADVDLLAAFRGEQVTIVDVRAASGALAAGLRPGMRIVAVDDRDIADAVTARMPTHLVSPDPAARDWALQVALAGRQDRQPARLVVDGIPREAFRPCPVVVRDRDAGEDPLLHAVVRLVAGTPTRCAR